MATQSRAAPSDLGSRFCSHCASTRTFFRSMSNRSLSPGRCTLTTTRWPFKRARCTCSGTREAWQIVSVCSVEITCLSSWEHALDSQDSNSPRQLCVVLVSPPATVGQMHAESDCPMQATTWPPDTWRPLVTATQACPSGKLLSNSC